MFGIQQRTVNLARLPANLRLTDLMKRSLHKNEIKRVIQQMLLIQVHVKLKNEDYFD